MPLGQSRRGLDRSAAVVARRFHERYEELAPMFGYRTREESAKPWAQVPEQNRKLMIATVMSLMDDLVIEPGEGC